MRIRKNESKKAAFKYGELLYVGPQSTVDELAELAREIDREHLRRLLASCLVRGILKAV